MSGEFVTIRTEGGLLPADLLARIVANDSELGGLEPTDYLIDDGTRPREAAARAWDKAKRYWAAFRAATEDLAPGESGVTQTRDQWLLPLLRDLGYRDVEFRPAAEVIGDRRYPISHRSGPVPLHLVSLRQDLDEVEATGSRRIKAGALLQEYLNVSDASWGIVANGRRLRLLRDSASLTRLAFVEFDLEAMFESGSYSDFVVLYLVIHRSRLPRSGVEASQCWLEKWRANADSLGARALGALRGGVEAAIEALGTGFLVHPANDDLRAQLTNGEVDAAGYYQRLLRLVYRLIFLSVAEERDLIFPPGASAENRRRYFENYGISRLRPLIRAALADDRHDDLWRGLRVTFDLIAGRREGLGIAALGSDLFARGDGLVLDDVLIANSFLAEAIRRLSWVKLGQVTRRVNYRDMDAEELGGVYEGLLERQPRVATGELNLHFELVKSGERKQTGSYYTPTSLVDELIRSALEPVIAERLAGAKGDAAKRAAILNLTVCDPACGSGHFLLAAARRLAREVARIDAGDHEPTPAQWRGALREVIGRCIHGVDLNPLAVDLCRLALWLESHDPGRPLRFLDGQIKLGNSLVGVFDLDAVKAGVPDGAYAPVTGDDKKAAALYKKLNAVQRAGQTTFTAALGDVDPIDRLARDLETLSDFDDRTVADVQTMSQLYAELHGRGTAYWNWKNSCDLWTAAFFAPLVFAEGTSLVPTTEIVWTSIRLPQGIDARVVAAANVLSLDAAFFHWPLEFPTVFERGGFDCVLGNPPWERIKLQEKEFFADRDPVIANATNKATRQRLIEALAASESGRALFVLFEAAQRTAEGESKFVRGSDRFPLTAAGDVNLYALFAELDCEVVNPRGRTGVIVPTGVATDDSTRRFFQHLTSHRFLVSYFGFKNEQRIFPPPVEHTVTFGLLTVVGTAQHSMNMQFTWLAYNTDHMNNPARRVVMSTDDFALFNPNTRTAPVFRTAIDAELTKAIYRRVPVLVDEATGANPWGVEFLRMLDMSNDSALFRDAPGPGLVPLYEAKLFHQYNHRWATYDGKGARDATAAELADPTWSVRPRYYVELEEVTDSVEMRWDRTWFISYRDIARATDERTVISSVLPLAGAACHVMLPRADLAQVSACLVGSLNSLVLDFAARTKIGGVHLNFFVVRQLPALPPSAFNLEEREFILPRILELTYTARDLSPFAEDLGYDGRPFHWDEERRALLRAELDAYYAALYGLTRDELRYILDPADVYGPDFPGETFRVLKEREQRQYGEYRTRRLVLEAWDRLGLAPRNREGRYAADATPMLSERGAEKNNKTSAHGTTTYSASTDAWDGVIVKKELPGFSNAVQGTFEDLQRDP